MTEQKATRSAETIPADELWLMVRGRVVRLGKPLAWAVVLVHSAVGGGIVWGLWRIGTALLRLCDIAEVK